MTEVKQTVTPILSWSLDCECPHCKEDLDLERLGECYPDHAAEISQAIFNNKWDDLEDYEFPCPECDKDIVIKEIVY